MSELNNVVSYLGYVYFFNIKKLNMIPKIEMISLVCT